MEHEEEDGGEGDTCEDNIKGWAIVLERDHRERRGFPAVFTLNVRAVHALGQGCPFQPRGGPDIEVKGGVFH